MVIFSVGCAEYRTERVNFDEIMKGVQTFLKKLPHEDGLPIVSSWNKVRDHIEALPRRAQRFPKMNLETLPKQQRLDLQVPEHLQSVEEIIKELNASDGKKSSNFKSNTSDQSRDILSNKINEYCDDF